MTEPVLEPEHPDVRAMPTIIGRSSSHFTRVVRIFAAELDVDYAYQIARDLMSFEPADYGGNPALRLPALRTSAGTWFGALNICRKLWGLSATRPRIVWPEELDVPLLANAQELTLQAMASGVALIMAGLASDAPTNRHEAKLRASLSNSLLWLNANVRDALAALPPARHVSFLEVTLFCLVTHLEFRGVLPVDPYAELNDFCRSFGSRSSAERTTFRFDT